MNTEADYHKLCNLAKLACWCKDNKNIIADEFKMHYFIQSNFVMDTSCDIAKIKPCGTSACFCGHGPSAGIEPLEDENWGEYGERNFTPVPTDEFAEEPHFDWLFGAGHADDINLAVNRAAYYIQMGISTLNGYNLNTDEVKDIDPNFQIDWPLLRKMAAEAK